MQICPGDLFRAEILSQTELGRQIKPIVEQGKYVDEAITCKLIAQRLESAIQQRRPFIIDGFPRTQFSFDFLIDFLRSNGLVDQVCFVQLTAPDAVCLQRIFNLPLFH